MANRAGNLRDRNLWPPDVPLQELGTYVAEGRPMPMPGAHAHLEVELNYVCQGRMTYQLAGGWVELAEGTLGAFWAALPHRLLEVDPETRCIWVVLPLAAVLQTGLPREMADRLLAGELLQTALPREVPTRWLGDYDAHAQRAMRLEVQAALLRMRPGPPSSQKAEAGAVAAMCRHVAANYREGLTVAAVAAAAGLHPNYAMRLFRSTTGMTVADYVLRHRLAHAQRLLLDSDLPVEVIAADSGFGSPSRFYEAFRSRLGQTPRAFRQND
ncbi:MAG: helix-turn-helix domain-containing protein [Fimbriimonas sp.]